MCFFCFVFFWLMEVAAEILLLLRSLLWPAAGAGCHRSPVRCSRAATTVMLSDFSHSWSQGDNRVLGPLRQWVNLS